MPLQATSGAASQDAFGGYGVAVVPAYIEEVFSTYLYTGTGAALTITNNIDLSTKGGLTWIKGRSGATGHRLTDTARGVTKSLESNSTAAEATESTGLTAFGTTGFTIGADADYNTSAATYASWTFRKQPKFFDVVTWTGDGANRTIAHALGSVPACIMVKRTDTTGDWQVYHRSLANTEYLVLNSTAAKATGATRWNSTTPTSTVFSLGTDATVNASGGTYVAYIFAHDAGGFGLTGTDNVISCGTYTGNGTAGLAVTLGYESQWVLIKQSSAAGNDWIMYDQFRGMTDSSGRLIYANASTAEQNASYVIPNATGFTLNTASTAVNGSGSTYIYIAIRRGPMKVPTTGTSVFSPNAHIGTEPTRKVITAGFPVDLSIQAYRNLSGAAYFGFTDRLRGGTQYLVPYDTSAEGASASPDNFLFDSNTTLTSGQGAWNNTNANGLSFNLLRRAPSFFDEVCYTGTGVARTVSHNLAAVPELMIVKSRSRSPSKWPFYSASTGNTKELFLNTTAAAVTNDTWNNTTPTSSVFSTDGGPNVNDSGSTYVAYLFATCAGVSKVGSYTGNGSSQTINCGFTGGARFVLIKASSTTGDWMVSDSARGIIAGSDPYLELNNTNAEVTGEDWLDTDSTGFVVNEVSASNANTNGVSYIFLAIA